MLLTIAVILVVIWAIGFFARLVGHIIHAVLLIAFIFLLAHYFKAGRLDQFGHDAEHLLHKKHHADY